MPLSRSYDPIIHHLPPSGSSSGILGFPRSHILCCAHSRHLPSRVTTHYHLDLFPSRLIDFGLDLIRIPTFSVHSLLADLEREPSRGFVFSFACVFFRLPQPSINARLSAPPATIRDRVISWITLLHCPWGQRDLVRRRHCFLLRYFSLLFPRPFLRLANHYWPRPSPPRFSITDLPSLACEVRALSLAVTHLPASAKSLIQRVLTLFLSPQLKDLCGYNKLHPPIPSPHPPVGLRKPPCPAPTLVEGLR